MKYISELKPAAAQSRPNAKVATGALPQGSHPARRNEPFGFPRAQARNAQSAQRNYERYLALARAEALAGDRIVAENYEPSTHATILGQTVVRRVGGRV